MNNYCWNCGTKLENGITTCPNCNVQIFDKRISVEQKTNEMEETKKKANRYFYLILALYFLPYILMYINKDSYSGPLGTISSISSLCAFILLIYARVKYSQSKKIRVLFGIFVFFIVLYILAIILIIMTCTGALSRGCY